MSHSSIVLADRYRLASRIARGGVGEVWRAVDLVLDRPVAVKLLRAEYAGHPETLTRFRAEARHAGALSHPGIAQVYDYCEADPPRSPYLVMELVDGPSLAGVLAAGQLGAARTMDVVAQAAEALDAAHAAGLVHRDIKPANLLVGPGGRVKITDFGIAHAAGSAPITRTGMLVGTPAYLAPERAEGAPATPASDLYSLGVVAYQCLSGAAPFTGSPLEVALAHRNLTLPPLPPGVPPEVGALVADLTAKDPAARPASAAEVARRAGQLRDAAEAGDTVQVAGPGHAPDCAADHTAFPADERAAATAYMPATLADTRIADAPPARPRWPRQARLAGTPRNWSRRGVALAAGAAVTAGLAGWLVAGITQAAAPRRHVGGAPARHAPSGTAARTVEVNGGLLTGQPASRARRLLRQLGLQPKVVWVPHGRYAPGTVIAVHPTGQVPVGTVVTVSAAIPPPGHLHGNGNGNGNGQGNGGN